MKPFLFTIPFILLLLLNACGTPPGVVPTDMGTAVAQTQTATMWTSTTTPSPINSQHIVSLLNIEPTKDSTFLTRLAQLEYTIGADYWVLDVKFPVENGVTIFQVDVNCTCGSKANCCMAEPMFLFTMLRIHANQQDITANLPPSVGKLIVKCYDHKVAFGGISANWADVQSFLLGGIDGGQFGFRVTPE